VDEANARSPEAPAGSALSELATLALLYALKGGPRAFCRWLVRDYRSLFPALPEDTRPFHAFVARFAEEMIVPTDTHFHARYGDLSNMEVCQLRTWDVRMVGTVLSMVTTVCRAERVRHRAWATFGARLAWLVAIFNILTQ